MLRLIWAARIGGLADAVFSDKFAPSGQHIVVFSRDCSPSRDLPPWRAKPAAFYP